MVDRDFLIDLREVATSAAEALEWRASSARNADSYQASEVADVAANGFRALADLVSRRLVVGEERDSHD